MGKFQIYQSPKSGEWYWRLLSDKGDNLLSSEGYKAREGCDNGIVSVKTNAPLDERYVKRAEKDLVRFWFVLRAANHEIIGSGSTRDSESARDEELAQVKAQAPTAAVEEAITE